MKKNQELPKIHLIKPHTCRQIIDEILDNDHFRFREIEKFNTRWNCIFSARNDGKSVSVDIDCCLFDFFTTERQTLYIRRKEDETKPTKVAFYWRDPCIFKFVNAAGALAFPGYSTYQIDAKAGEIFLFGRTEEGREDKLAVIGYYCSIEKYRDRKSTGNVSNVRNCLYEEFLASQEKELKNEFEDLLNTISTYTRDRDFKVYCIGNTVRRRSAIFEGFGVNTDDIVPGIAQVFKYKTKDGEENDLTVYHVPETESRKRTVKSYFFGDKNKSNLIGDEWYVSDYPPIPPEFAAETFKPRVAFRILNGQITLYCYVTSTGRMVCTSTRWVSFVDYITICDRTDITRKWFSKDGVPKIMETLRRFVAHGWVYYENNYCGDDLRTFLE